MANIEHVNVAGQVYDIRVSNGSSLSLSSLTVTGTSTLGRVSCAQINSSGLVIAPSVSAITLTTQSLKVSGTSNLSSVNCDSLSTNKNIVLRHDSLDIDITWVGRDEGGGTYRWDVLSISAASNNLCTFNQLSPVSHPNHLLPDTLRIIGTSSTTRHVTVNLTALKNLGPNAFDEPTSQPQSESDTSITSQIYSFDYILFGAEIL